MFIFYLIIISFIISIGLIPLAIKIAWKYSIIDTPDLNLKTHKKETPYLGGAVVFLSILITAIILFLIRPEIVPDKIWGTLFASLFILILGLIDDIKDIKPGIKLIFETLIAILLVKIGIYIQIKYLPLWLNYLLSIFWIITMTNASNLIDILDGLCSGIVFISSLTFLTVGYITGDIFSVIISSLLAGSIAGFFLFNRSPAKIYLGDAGSLFSGFLLAAVSISISYTKINNLGLFVPILILGIPLYDTLLVIIFRLNKKKSPFIGSNDHFALRLKNLGFTETETVNLIYLISISLSILSIIIIKIRFKAAILVYLIILLLGYIFGKILSKLEIK